MAGLHCLFFHSKHKGIFMKKAMLFVIALFFSVAANAATLNLTKGDSAFTNNASQEIDLASGSTVLASGTTGNGAWESSFSLFTNDATPVVIEWSFNPESNLDNATIAFGVLGGAIQNFDITGDFSFTAILTAGLTYVLDIYDATGKALNYSLSVSAVPVPAALFLFAPVLLGFLGFRKKAIAA